MCVAPPSVVGAWSWQCGHYYMCIQQVLQAIILIPVRDVVGSEADDVISFKIVNENMVDNETISTEVVVPLSVSAFADVGFQDL